MYKVERLCIYPKDIMRITGKSERYGRSLIQKIKKELGKLSHQLITVDDFCVYTGLEASAVIQRIAKYE